VDVDLPVIVDWVEVDKATGDEIVRVEARVDLVHDEPAIVKMSLSAPDGLDLPTLQRDFRWNSPLTVVTAILPRLIAAGSDPSAADIPVDGFPAVAIQPSRRKGILSDEFLTTIAREYLARGRGYATSLAEEYVVTPRTVVSWVEKARERGLLSAPPSRGATGGRLIEKPQSKRPRKSDRTGHNGDRG
jgi:transposase-like protein